MMPQELLNFWPSTEEINRCIKAEAESAHESLILAVHQSTPLAMRATATGDRVEHAVTEQQLLNAFLTQDLPTGTLLFPITGQSGVGKSHMIRWLYAQLKRTAEYEAGIMHIIRIPKSASLRMVIRLILDPLKGEQYDRLRDALQTAADAVTTEVAGIQLRYGLEIGLKQLQTRLQQEIPIVSSVEERQQLKLSHAHAATLPSLFSDDAVKDQYEKVLSGIIMRAVEGKQQEDRDQIPRFEADDLLLSNHRSLLKSAFEVQRYYQRIEGDPAERQKAAEVLNEVLDSAIGFAFNLGQSLGGKTLQDIFLDIRQQLFMENKELVLLIEDFAALAGIQDPLLKICIQEAIRDGEQVLCRMRTAVAVTDGDWSGRDTVLTRVQNEWRVKSKLSSEDEIIDKAVELVGAYLNAARIGDEELRRLFVAVQDRRDADLFSWLPTYGTELQDETLETLQAFGKSQKEYWLFPFNRAAITELARKKLSEGGELVFNPRSIINGILRNVLLKRDLYEKGEFPEPNFENVSASMFTAERVARSGFSGEVKGQYNSLLCFWGGNPKNERGFESIPALVPKAFGLEPLQEMVASIKTGNSDPKGFEERESPEKPERFEEPVKPERFKSPETPVSPPKPEQSPLPPPSAVNPKVKRWEDVLEGWVNSVSISQTDANQLRNLLSDALKNYINWNAVFLAPPAGKISDDIYFNISLAMGTNAARKIEVVVADNNKDEDARLRRAFMALVRYNDEGTWDYPGGEEDCLHYVEMMERLATPVIDGYRQLADKRTTVLCSLLAWTNHILGAAPPILGNDPKALMNSIWGIRTETPAKSLHEEWDACRRECHNFQMTLLNSLNVLSSAFQGDTGKLPLAVDAARIVWLLQQHTLYADIPGEVATSLFAGSPAQTAVRGVAALTRNFALKGRIAKHLIPLIVGAEKTFSELVVHDDDMAMAAKELKMLITQAQADGMSWPSTVATSADQLQVFVDGLANADLDSLQKKLTEIMERFAEGDCQHVAYAIALLDQSHFHSVVFAAKQINSFLLEMEKKLDEMTNLAVQNDPKPVAEKIGALLGEIEETVKQAQEAEHDAP